MSPKPRPGIRAACITKCMLLYFRESIFTCFIQAYILNPVVGTNQAGDNR